MAEQICVGIKTNGDSCNRRVQNGTTRCATHTNTINTHGVNTVAIRELEYSHKKACRELGEVWNQRIQAEENLQRRGNLILDYELASNLLKLQQRHDREVLRRRQREEIDRTGIDPDAAANARRHQARVAQFERQDNAQVQRQRQLNRHPLVHIARNLENDFIHLDDEDLLQQARVLLHGANPQRNIGELARFAADNQNVHTTQAVKQTKESVAIIMGIPVPNEYKWNMRECSKTPGDIIMTCKLTPKAAWQMSAKYCQDESIYDLEKGIYGKVLDGVWQFILSSPDKNDICRGLKQEMEDNIGMCAQGNLSRLCNILAGYIDGIGPQESSSEILGRMMPKFMELESVSERLDKAFKLFGEIKLPVDQWDDWLQALVSDQDSTYDVRHIKNNENVVTGFMAVAI